MPPPWAHFILPLCFLPMRKQAKRRQKRASPSPLFSCFAKDRSCQAAVRSLQPFGRNRPGSWGQHRAGLDDTALANLWVLSDESKLPRATGFTGIWGICTGERELSMSVPLAFPQAPLAFPGSCQRQLGHWLCPQTTHKLH